MKKLTALVLALVCMFSLAGCQKKIKGPESYSFNVKGEAAFTYENRGSEAYTIIDGNYYKVSDPSAPPID